MNKKVVVYIFYDSKRKKYLVENRTHEQVFAGLQIFPGGKVENDEVDDLQKALFREIKEETGVDVVKYVDLRYSVIGEADNPMYPFLITNWKGTIPEVSLDRGSKFEWIDVAKFEPKLKSVKKILAKVNEYVAQS